MKNLNENNYVIVKKAISKELSVFCYDYFKLKRHVFNIINNSNLKDQILIHDMWGTYQDALIPNTYSHYSDLVMETLLIKLQNLMEKQTKLKLYPSYSYARIYKKGDELKRHKDRLSCEISTTLFLGGEEWPIFLEPSGELNKEGIKIDLEIGDMLIYKGCVVEHWREVFKGNECTQVFLHYNSEKNKKNLFDNRPHLGMPSMYRNSIIKKI
jgi:hypothetical protein